MLLSALIFLFANFFWYSKLIFILLLSLFVYLLYFIYTCNTNIIIVFDFLLVLFLFWICFLKVFVFKEHQKSIADVSVCIFPSLFHQKISICHGPDKWERHICSIKREIKCSYILFKYLYTSCRLILVNIIIFGKSSHTLSI